LEAGGRQRHELISVRVVFVEDVGHTEQVANVQALYHLGHSTSPVTQVF
jgi:hypothetical protein